MRILLYSHDSYGLGHIRRTLGLAWGLASAFERASLLCITGSPRAEAFSFPPRTDYVKLPAVTKDAEGHYLPRDMPVPFSRVLALRERLIGAAFRSFRPHLVLVDHSPLGMGGELIAALRQARKGKPGTRIVLGLRDIYDEGAMVRQAWSRDGVGQVLEEVYDRILVYGEEGIFDVTQEYGLSPSAAGKLIYTGYVHRREAVVEPAASIRRRLRAERRPLVLVTVGGGEDGHTVVRNYLEGLAAMNGDCGWWSLIVMGPLMRSAKRNELAIAAQRLPGVSVLDFTPRLRDYLAAADLVLTMGGYNTVVEALVLGKRTVVVPRVSPRREQLVRAERFSRHGLLRWLDPRRAQGADFVEIVRSSLAEAPLTINGRLNVGGVGRTVAAVARLLSREPRRRNQAAVPRAEGNGNTQLGQEARLILSPRTS